MTTAARVRDVLGDVVDPCSAATGSNLDIVEMGMVASVTVDDGHVDVSIRLTTPACLMAPYFIEEARSRVGSLPGVETVAVETDDGTEWTPERLSEAAEETRGAVLDDYEDRYAGLVDERLAAGATEPGPS